MSSPFSDVGAPVTLKLQRQLEGCLSTPPNEHGVREVTLKMKGSLMTANMAAETQKDLKRGRCEGDGTAEPSLCCAASSRAASILKHAYQQLSQSGKADCTLVGCELRNLELTADCIHSTVSTRTTDPRRPSVSCLLFSSEMPWRSPVVALVPAACALTMLDLESNPLRDDGVQAICKHLLPHTPNLSRLHLASTAMTMTGLYTIVNTLCGGADGAPQAPLPCPRMSVLGLTNNPLEVAEEAVTGQLTAGALLVRFAAAFHRTLSRMHLNHAGVTTADAAALLSHIMHLPTAAFPQLDTIYLKQNSGVDHDQLTQCLAWSTLHQPTRDATASALGGVNAFLTKHVLL